ncbi:MAG: signal peptidase I [bacterium]|nr:signal peptidase I [bacterium]
MNNLKKFILSVLFLPIILTIETFKSSRELGKKIIYFFIVWFFIGTVWIIGYLNLFSATQTILFSLGITDKLINIPVRGTSMLPTIKDGSKVTLHSPKKFKVTRGDIVSFSNIETDNLHYIKRVVGLPNDTILLKNGQIYINGQPIEETYVFNNEPTYGNTFMVECQTYTVPKGKVAVFGDNRIASTDSRVVGYVDLNDIDGVIKTGITFTYTDPQTISQTIPKINLQLFVDKLNKKRKEKGVAPLQIQNILTTVATNRAQIIAKNVDNWKQNPNQLSQSLTDAKYDYLLFQEITTFGAYNEDQLTEHVMELQPYNLDFISSRYYEIGLGSSNINSYQCQIPVIEIILGWPTKPSVSQDVIDGWQLEINNLTKVISALNNLKTVQQIDISETQTHIQTFSNFLEQANKFKTIAVEGRWLTKTESDEEKSYGDQLKVSAQKLADFLRKNSSNIIDPNLTAFLANYKWGNLDFNKESNNAKLLFAQGKFQELITSSQKLLTLSTNNDEKSIAYYWMGLAYYSLNQFPEAKTNELNAIQNNPNYAAAYSTLAAISFKEQDYNQGLTYSLKCNELDPKYSWCHNNLAISYFNLGNKTKAIEEMKIAVSLDPTSYTFNDNLKRMQAGM